MNKILVSSLVALVALGANVASAQSYYQPYSYNTYGASYVGTCVNLVSDLQYGSRGNQVSQLQTFLVSRNFPGGGSWMITGNFKSATLAAVRSFQQSQGLMASGVVDAATRAAISRVSCLSGQGGGYSSGYNYNNIYPNTYATPYNYHNINCYYTYPYTCNNYNYGSVMLTSLSVTGGQPGTNVTIYGSGFDYSNNTVYFGMTPLTNISSYNGTSLTFTVPSYVSNGTIGVYVTNSRGTSNTLSFTVTSNTYPNSCNYPYNYGSCCQSGQVGQFTQGYGGYVYGYGYQYCPPQGVAPSITSLNGPTSLTAGVQGTWTIQVNNPGNSYMTTSVNWGDAGVGYASAAAPQTTYQQGVNTLTFTHTYYAAGTYTVVFTVSNASGQMNTSSATVNVTGTGSYGNVTLTSISPMSGRVGTQIVLTGSGFNPLDNTVRFGIGGTQHVPSFNSGTTIYYTVPSFVSPCDVATFGNICAQNIQQVLPGLIQVYVTNSAGTTNTLTFQVTN